jgi:NADH-quinone oxidoreductase subunit L
LELVYLLIPLSCLGAAVAVGFLGSVVGRVGAHTIAIAGVAISFLLSIIVAVDVSQGHHFNGVIYTWGQSGGVVFTVGFLIDELTAVMMVVVTFVSLMVHVYTIGYMAEDPGYTRFFCHVDACDGK